MSPAPALVPVDLVVLDRALEAPAAVDARKSRVIELRFFGGLSVEQTADVLHVSADTVKTRLAVGETLVLRELAETHGDRRRAPRRSQSTD